MAEVDGQWPTEDEDFDATIDKAGKSGAPAVATKSKVQVVDADSEDSTSDMQAKDTNNDQVEESSATNDSSEATVPEEPNNQEPSEPEPAAEPEPQAVGDDSHLEEPTKPSVVSESKNHRGLRTVFEVLLVVAVVALGLWSWTLYNDRNDLQDQVTKLNQNPQIAVQKQTDALIARVGALIDLPKGESPTIANVSDANQAKKQSAFFNSSQNGDKVLMYVKAGEAILYRPSTNKIILVAPLTFNNNTTKASSTATTPKTSTGTTTTR